MPTYARDNQRVAHAASRQLHILLLILPVLVTGYLLSNGKSGAPKLWDQAQRIGVLRTDIARLKKGNESLTQDIRLLTNDPKTIERIARERYGMVKDNESVYMVYPRHPKGKSP
jgi:cell division protein FtsB